MSENAPLDLRLWIDQYLAFMQQSGYAAASIRRRGKHLQFLQRFAQQTALVSLEEFEPRHCAQWIDYWLRENPAAKKGGPLRRRSRFEPAHHIGLQYSLRSFLRWARGAGHLERDIFPLREPVRGHYLFPQVGEYLHFCREHKGLALNTCNQIELFLRRLDRFLQERHIGDWNQLEIRYIDVFVRQQAAHNVGRIQRIHKILRGFLRYLFSQGQLDRDLACAIHSPRQYRLARTPRALASDQVLALLAGIDRQQPGGKRDFAIVLTAASLGVRCQEMAALRLQDLDWKQQSVRFQQAKNDSLLRLPLSRPLIEALADYLKNERPAASPHREVFLRLTAPHTPLHPGSVSGLIQRRMGQAGLSASAHQLRHTLASEMLRAGVSYSTLQELLGHRHLTSTLVYTKIDLTQLREVAQNDAQRY